MKWLRIHFVALCVTLIGSPVAVQRALAQQEFLIGGFDPKAWTLAYQGADQNQRILEFVPPGQKIDNWTELFTILTLRKPDSPPDIDALAAASHKNLSKRCADNVVWNVIERQLPTNTELAAILFEWSVKNCPPESDQHEVAKIVYGKFTIFRIAYVAKTQALAPGKREQWIKELSASRIVDRR